MVFGPETYKVYQFTVFGPETDKCLLIYSFWVLKHINNNL